MTPTDKLAARIEAFGRARVLVLGDVMVDRYVYGSVERISPEAPVPVLKTDHERFVPGGAGNVARNIAALQGKVTLIGLIGADAAGTALRGALTDSGAIVADLVVDPSRQTTEKIRFVHGRHQLFRADAESVAPAEGDSAAALLAAFRRHLADADVVVLSDYAKGVLSGPVLGEAIAAAHAAKKLIVADPKQADYNRYRGVDVLTPNRPEIARAIGAPCDTDVAVVAAARHITYQAGIGAVLVTRGEQGMTLLEKSHPGEPRHLRAEAREVYDVTGAGDTVVATLAVALAVGADLPEAAGLANTAAGLVVAKAGTAITHPAEIVNALRGRSTRATDAKIVPLDVALARVLDWRARGERVGFTNGCFDLIHPGHISLLTQARAACDRLIVAVNADASVRRLKGPTRPVQGEMARAVVLASLAAVDLVVIFEEDTPIPLLEALKPDVLIKGADYSMDQVVGGDLVQAYGGKVVLAALTPGESTTHTIAKLTG
ncbi:MAG TPA: D-glycero-beta-D-manno-heptose-7-phosphate kinase [Candidatus Sulfotelmatobacter sp.]|nr:D-glycero-beta-D-manno-heptose-7-phosphate kinase [Candidatus Sulfotelmatobacter sp.]